MSTQTPSNRQQKQTSTAEIANEEGTGLMWVEAASFWSNVAVAALTVLAAIAGVLAVYFGVKAAGERDKADAAFRLKADTNIAALETSTADSNRKAAEAMSNLAAANARAEEARKDAAEANRLAESFRRDIAQANERAASANQTAEREKLARLQLEARLAPRVLTKAQQEAVGNALKSAGLFAVQLLTCSDVSEVGLLGDAISTGMAAGGWRVSTAKVLGAGFTVSGIAISVRSNAPAARLAAERLVVELARHGISSAVIPEPLEKVQPLIGATMGHVMENPDLLVMIGNK